MYRNTVKLLEYTQNYCKFVNNGVGVLSLEKVGQRRPPASLPNYSPGPKSQITWSRCIVSFVCITCDRINSSATAYTVTQRFVQRRA